MNNKSIPMQTISHLGVRFHEDTVEALLSKLRTVGFDPDIIVVETLRRVLDGSENEAAHVANFWHSVSPILAAGKTLILSHHMDILAGADLAYAITRNQNDLTIRCEKNRVAPEIEPFKIQLVTSGIDEEQDSVIMRYVGQPPSSEDERSKMDQAKEAILAFLQEQQMFIATTEAILHHLDQLGIAERTGEQALKVLCQTGMVEKIERGVYRLGNGPKVV